MDNETKHYTKEDIEKMEAKCEQLQDEIDEAKMSLRRDTANKLQAKYSKTLPGMVVCRHRQFDNFIGAFLLIVDAIVTCDDDYGTFNVKMYGPLLRITKFAVDVENSCCTIPLDDDGNMRNILLPGKELDDAADYELHPADEFANESGVVRKMMDTAIKAHIQAHTASVEYKTEKFFRVFNHKWKELLEAAKTAETAPAESGTVTGAPDNKE